MEQPLTQNEPEGEFGTSTFGPRLSYSQKVYRDPVFGIAYYIHLLAIVVIGIYFFAHEWDTINSGASSTKTSLNLTGIIVSVTVCAVSGTVVGLIWLQVVKMFAATIIKFMLFLNMGAWVVVAIIGVITGVLGLIVIGVILFLLTALYAYCVWHRIPFSAALLTIATTIVQTYEGTIYISIIVIVFDIIWTFIWGLTFVAYITVSQNHNNTNQFVIFLLLISLYWGLQVNQNISHTTTCGVAATWYFSTSIDKSPTRASFARTMTTSFGSVCLGSLIVAFLQALRAMLRNSRGNAAIKCIALCLLACIENLIRYFNQYAFAQCAIYGTSFIESAKATWNLFTTRGILAIINDDLTGMAIMFGSFLGLAIAGVAGYFIGYEYYNDQPDWDFLPIVIAFFGAIVGFVLCFCILVVVRSAIICLFVCFAEDPSALANNRPDEYNRITGVKPELAQIHQNFGNTQ